MATLSSYPPVVEVGRGPLLPSPSRALCGGRVRRDGVPVVVRDHHGAHAPGDPTPIRAVALARDAARFGLRVRVILDAGLWDAAQAADRVWVGTESIGTERVITSAGVTGLAELCANQEIPLELLATTDAVHPSGAGVAAPVCDADRVWGERPAGVTVEAVQNESVPTRSFHRWYCEHGVVGLGSEEWALSEARPALCTAAENMSVDSTAARI